MWIVMVQPNKKMAIFSTVVDHFLATNITHDEAVRMLISERGYSPEIAQDTANGAKEDLGRFADAMESILFIHGQAEYVRLMTELSAAPMLERRP